jgi:hypothetical protein
MIRQLFFSGRSCDGFKVARQFDTLKEIDGQTKRQFLRPPNCLEVGFVPLIALYLTCALNRFCLEEASIGRIYARPLFIAINSLLQQLTTII